MRYITVYGESTERRVITKDKVYWLAHKNETLGKGFFLLKKDIGETYIILRTLMKSKE